MFMCIRTHGGIRHACVCSCVYSNATPMRSFLMRPPAYLLMYEHLDVNVTYFRGRAGTGLGAICGSVGGLVLSIAVWVSVAQVSLVSCCTLSSMNQMHLHIIGIYTMCVREHTQTRKHVHSYTCIHHNVPYRQLNFLLAWMAAFKQPLFRRRVCEHSTDHF